MTVDPANDFVVSPEEVAKLAAATALTADRLQGILLRELPSPPREALGGLPASATLHENLAAASRAMEALVRLLATNYEHDATRLFTVSTTYQRHDDQGESLFGSLLRYLGI